MSASKPTHTKQPLIREMVWLHRKESPPLRSPHNKIYTNGLAYCENLPIGLMDLKFFG